MNLTTAFNVFVRQAVLQRAIPFKLYRDLSISGLATSAEQHRAAMQEIRDLLADIDRNSIDLDITKEERRATKIEHND